MSVAWTGCGAPGGVSAGKLEDNPRLFGHPKDIHLMDGDRSALNKEWKATLHKGEGLDVITVHVGTVHETVPFDREFVLQGK